jgi:hypothetical protein
VCASIAPKNIESLFFPKKTIRGLGSASTKTLVCIRRRGLAVSSLYFGLKEDQIVRIICTLVCLSLCTAAGAATFDDPEWPCVQRKVENLSLGIMWPHPVSAAKLRDGLAESGNELIASLALRRVDLVDAETLINKFVKANPDVSRDDLGHLFRGVFERISTERTEIIGGITRYSLRQILLSEAIDDTRVKMSALMEADTPDFDTIDALEEKLDWDERIFYDRTQSLTYVCETPVLLEKRAFAIAQLLLQHVPG